MCRLLLVLGFRRMYKDTRRLFVATELLRAQGNVFGGDGAGGAGDRREVDQQIGEPHWEGSGMS